MGAPDFPRKRKGVNAHSSEVADPTQARILLSALDQLSINKIEKVQATFVNRISDPSLVGLNYWKKLSTLGLLSQERRRERFQICLLWKISQGLFDGYDVNWSYSDRRGRTIVTKEIVRNAPSKERAAREKSLGVHGARLFNLLPKNLRNEDSGDYDLFKNNLDIFLSTIPDEPTTSGLVRAASSNSLLDQIPAVLTL